MINTLYGWDIDTWERAIKWAGSDLDAKIWHQELWPQFMEIRHKWLKAGGPMTGPSSSLSESILRGS